MATYNHLLLTRFNMRENLSNPKIPDIQWHQERFKLFEKYCYSSIKSQTNLNFTWLVFFDELTPKQFLNRINSYKELSNFTPIFSDNLTLFRDFIDNNSDYLITTRLDNDDGVSNDFVDCIQKQFDYQKCEFINFDNGYIICKDKLYNYTDNSNPFLSLIEKVSEQSCKTVWCTMHHKASEVSNIIHVKDKPIWLQVVHSTNVSNRVKGIRTKNDKLKSKFNFNLQKNNNYFDYYFDLLCLSQLRIIRETSFKVLKKVLTTNALARLKNHSFFRRK